ncbi:MAG: PKD domain-containing protein [Opitutaceae bacterium]
MTTNSSFAQLASGSSVDAFQLHSLPGATRVIYLDFDGHTTSGTQWNSSYTGGAPIVSTAFDMDGDPATFNVDERAAIESIWKRVAEDYAPFAIDVTTQDPGLEALRKTTTSDNAYGIRVVISPTNWYNGGAGGTAYLGSFNWNSDTPCWVFTQQLANAEKYIGEATSHEVGHTFGLYHDGVGGAAPSEYYYGQGNWAPIMGVGYYKGLTQFSKGDYTDATNLQDDVAVIATYAPLTADDHGNALSTATALQGPAVASGGTIETRADLDVFRFDTAAGTISLSVTSPSVETDLHMQAELLNSSGQVLQSNDISALSATFSPTLAAGTYYLRIGGIGYGSPTGTGYSDYGSLGNYVIAGTLIPIIGQQSPTAVATASVTSGTAPLTVAFSSQGSADPDGSIVAYRWDFGNGASSTAANPTYTYNSAGPFIAVLTVTDNSALAGTASVFVSVAAPTNQAPVAIAAASALIGTAPLPVSFSSAGSSDPDGTIQSYAWNFGDGTTSTSASPSKTFTAPGTYMVSLTVTDNLGATGTATVTIAVTVGSDPNADCDVQQYSLSKASAPSGTTATATVTLRDRLDRPVVGATVTIQWSGLISGSSTGKTDTAGQAVIKSPRTKKNGLITATIQSVTPLAGVIYDPNIYAAPTVLSVPTN